MAPGSGSSSPAEFTETQGHVFFRATTPSDGAQLWALPLTPGSAIYIEAPQTVGVAAGTIATIPITYGNAALQTAEGVTVSVTLADGLTYLGASGNITPTVQGQTLSWRVPALAFAQRQQIALQVQVPEAAQGTRYATQISSASAGSDGNTEDNQASLDVLIARQLFAPLAAR